MNWETIREFLRKRPFEPFLIRLSDGERHEIREPESALVTTSRLVVVDPATDRFSLRSVEQVVEIRRLGPVRA